MMRHRRRGLLVLAWLLVLLAPATSFAQEQPFAVGPYLLDVSTDAATVAFHLSAPLAAEVVVHMGGAEAVRFPSPQPRRAHFVRVTGLQSGQTYEYQVSVGGGAAPAGDGRQQIRTACQAGESFTFVAYGDPRPGDNQSPRHHELVVDQILQVEPAFSLVLGDMVDDGADPRQWERFFAVEAELRARSAIFPVLGDNDYADGRGRARDYFSTAAEGPYHFTWGGVHFFAMNAWGTLGPQPSDEVDATSEQVRWLDEQLARAEVQGAAFRVVFLHDPIFIGRGRSAEVMRRVWGPLLSERGVDLVLASWHLYERSRHQGVTYLISGGAGAELVWLDENPSWPSQAEARRHHFVRIDVKAGAMHIRAVAEDGTVLDSLTLFPRSAGGQDAAESLQRSARRLGRLIPIAIGAEAGQPELDLQLFSYDCGYCRRLLEGQLPAWSRQYGVGLRVHYFDLGLTGAYDLLMAAGADFGRQDAPIPTVMLGRTVLGGEAEIQAGLPRELQRFRDDPGAYREQAFVPFQQGHDTRAMRTERFESLTWWVVLAAGLIDGVNPCAFTTIIFLLSYLTVAGGTRRQILLAGGVFTLAVFLTYLAIGLLFYQLASVLMGQRVIATIVNVVMLAGLVVLAVLSLRDGVRSLRGHPTDMTLKLPAFLQDRIRARIRAFARHERTVTTAAFSLGVVIAGMELACTGQVYVPIVTMLAEPHHRATASLYLLAYNTAFIVPLVLVFLLAVFGLTSQRLVGFARRHVASAKLALALLFAGLALVVSYNLGWIS